MRQGLHQIDGDVHLFGEANLVDADVGKFGGNFVSELVFQLQEFVAHQFVHAGHGVERLVNFGVLQVGGDGNLHDVCYKFVKALVWRETVNQLTDGQVHFCNVAVHNFQQKVAFVVEVAVDNACGNACLLGNFGGVGVVVAVFGKKFVSTIDDFFASGDGSVLLWYTYHVLPRNYCCSPRNCFCLASYFCCFLLSFLRFLLSLKILPMVLSSLMNSTNPLISIVTSINTSPFACHAFRFCTKVSADIAMNNRLASAFQSLSFTLNFLLSSAICCWFLLWTMIVMTNTKMYTAVTASMIQTRLPKSPHFLNTQ